MHNVIAVLAAFLSAIPFISVHDWLPMHIGDRWIYEVEILDGNRNHPDVEKWQQEVTTLAIQAVPKGTLLKRKVTLLNATAPSQSAADWSPESNILIRDNCAYYDFRQDVKVDEALPDVCFPLRPGTIWGDAQAYRDHWTVAGLGRKHPGDPTSVTPESWRLEAHLSSGDDNYVWFQKNIGIVASRRVHNGTYLDYRMRLLSFRPGN